MADTAQGGNMKKKITAFVINHGHMDIEWYQPYDSYRFWITDAIAQLCDIVETNPQYATYVFDGAIALLDEAIDTDPDLEQKIKEMIAQGKLSVGPFYTQFDEWLNGGETIITNCLWGDRKSRRYGDKLMLAGHLLDNFGHPAQLAQILRNFGIDSLLFTRGMPEFDDDSKEFILRGQDGSEVLAVNFNYSTAFSIYANNNPRPPCVRTLPYGNAEYNSYEYLTTIAEHRDKADIAAQLIRNIKRNAVYYPSGIVPVFVGCDHCPPQAGLSDTLAYASSIQDEIEFKTGNSQDYIAFLKDKAAFPEHDGELIGSFNDYILLGANSTRNYLKMAHFGSELNLYRYLLPLSAYASMLGAKIKRAAIEEAQKKLLLNSTHDSIHGTSLDCVHLEMEYRTSAIDQICTALSHESLDFIGSACFPLTARSIVCFAPARGIQPCTVWLPIGTGVRIFQGEKELPVSVKKREELPKNSRGEPVTSYAIAEEMKQVTFLADFRANEVLCLRYEPVKDACAATFGQETSIENEYFSVQYTKNGLCVTDRRTGFVYDDLFTLEDAIDYGDVWDYSESPLKTKIYRFRHFLSERVFSEHNATFSSLTVAGCLSVPKCAEGDLRSKEHVKIPVKLTVRLYPGIRRVDAELDLKNTAKDHRLRLRTFVPGRTGSIRSGGIFGINERPVRRPVQKKPWASPPTKFLPFREWLALDAGKNSLAVAVKGLYEYEAAYERGGTAVYVTLFRSVGLINKINLPLRGGAPGGNIAIPEAQCLRDFHFSFSFLPYSADSKDKTPFLCDAYPFLTPPVAHEMYGPPPADPSKTAASFLPFEFESNKTEFSAFRQSFDGDSYILRFFENQGRHVSETIRLFGFSKAFLSDMNETRGKELPLNDGKLFIDVPPYKIITLLLEK